MQQNINSVSENSNKSKENFSDFIANLKAKETRKAGLRIGSVAGLIVDIFQRKMNYKASEIS